MELQDKFKNLCWWAEQMIEQTRRSYYDWLMARENLEKQETWLNLKGRMEETLAALDMIWKHPEVTDEIKRAMHGKVSELNDALNKKRILLWHEC